MEETCKVYNLTLLEHNAYYANGVLVANCADSFLIGLELCRERLGFTAIGMEQKQDRPRNDFNQRVKAINRIFQHVNYEPEIVNA